jgi:hypothetical protein
VTLVELNVTIGYDKLRLKVTIRNVDNVNVTIRDIAKSRTNLDLLRFVTFLLRFVTKCYEKSPTGSRFVTQ